MTNDPNTIVLKTTPQSAATISALTTRLKETPAGVLSKALSLLQMMQGRKVILKGQDGTWEISDFINNQVSVKIK